MAIIKALSATLALSLLVSLFYKPVEGEEIVKARLDVSKLDQSEYIVTISIAILVIPRLAVDDV